MLLLAAKWKPRRAGRALHPHQKAANCRFLLSLPSLPLISPKKYVRGDSKPPIYKGRLASPREAIKDASILPPLLPLLPSVNPKNQSIGREKAQETQKKKLLREVQEA